jgi:oligopeptide/dipeptide ABC transporter ATP-binding protein
VNTPSGIGAPLLEVRGLSKHFRLPGGRVLHAVDGVSLSLHEREVVGLVGESGCGKSTLGKTVVGLLDKTGGEVRYRGEVLPARYRPADFRRYGRKLQLIFQDPYSALDPRMTVQEIVAEGPRFQGLWPEREAAERAGTWLERVGLARSHLSRYPHEFSGGQRQRIGIARALALEPELVVCDEPISALDVSVQAQVVNLLGELRETLGLTLLFVAHDLSMVRHASDRMAVMYLGQVVELGPAAEVYFRPKHPYTRSLIASNPDPDPERARRRLPLAPLGETGSPIDPPPGCRFAPRCPEVQAICRERDPAWLTVGNGHFAACHALDGWQRGKGSTASGSLATTVS